MEKYFTPPVLFVQMFSHNLRSLSLWLYILKVQPKHLHTLVVIVYILTIQDETNSKVVWII